MRACFLSINTTPRAGWSRLFRQTRQSSQPYTCKAPLEHQSSQSPPPPFLHPVLWTMYHPSGARYPLPSWGNESTLPPAQPASSRDYVSSDGECTFYRGGGGDINTAVFYQWPHRFLKKPGPHATQSGFMPSLIDSGGHRSVGEDFLWTHFSRNKMTLCPKKSIFQVA